MCVESQSEEILKSWHYAVSDEVVYLNETSEILGNTGSIAAELYRNGSAFIDLKIAFEGQRNGYCHAIIRAGSGRFARRRSRKFDCISAPLHRNTPMLVEVTNLVQPPQRVSLIGCTSMVWLKFIDNFDGINRNPTQLPSESFSGLRAGVVSNWELDVPWNLVDSHQRPNQVVERCPHVIKSIASNQTDAVGNEGECPSELIKIIRGIFIMGDSIGFRRIAKLPHLSLKSIEMILRPTQLGFSVFYGSHA
jgi:hypothetical protein